MLSGKTAVVTGSTSGIGLGIAEALATRGVNIVLNGFGEAAAVEDFAAVCPANTTWASATARPISDP
jgi:3-hydroxybutyrate dehydrogenase